MKPPLGPGLYPRAHDRERLSPGPDHVKGGLFYISNKTHLRGRFERGGLDIVVVDRLEKAQDRLGKRPWGPGAPKRETHLPFPSFDQEHHRRPQTAFPWPFGLFAQSFLKIPSCLENLRSQQPNLDRIFSREKKEN